VNSPIVIDDNGSVETEASANEGSVNDVQFIGENLDPPNIDPDKIHEIDDDRDNGEAKIDDADEQEDEIETEETPETEDEEASIEEITDETGEELGKGRRIKKKPKRLIEDENWGLRRQRGQNHTCLHEEVKMEVPTPKQSKGERKEDETWRVKDGVLHLNPAYLEFACEALKVRNNIDDEIEDGVTQLKLNIKDVQECSNGNSGHKTNMEDHVVMHMLGVIMAQQYSIQKGIKLFGDEGRKSVSKELQQLHVCTRMSRSMHTN
jgi:hypothetical protein